MLVLITCIKLHVKLSLKRRSFQSVYRDDYDHLGIQIHISFAVLQPGARELFGLGKGRKAKRKQGGGKGGNKPAPQPGSTQQPSAAGGRASFMPRGVPNPLGGLLAMSAKGQLRCPDAIVRMRATVARMKPVRELRPQVNHFSLSLTVHLKAPRPN